MQHVKPLPRRFRLGKYTVEEDGKVSNIPGRVVFDGHTFENGVKWAEEHHQLNQRRTAHYRARKLKSTSTK